MELASAQCGCQGFGQGPIGLTLRKLEDVDLNPFLGADLSPICRRSDGQSSPVSEVISRGVGIDWRAPLP